jgi:hypothetical protein
VQTGVEGRRNLKLATMVGRETAHLAFNHRETQDAARVARGIGGNRPADDHLVAYIRVHRAAMVADRFEKETRDEVVHPKLAHCFGKPCRVGDVERYHDQVLADWTMVDPKNDAGEKRAADQPPRLGHDANDQGESKADQDDSRQPDGQPKRGERVEMIGLPVEQKLQGQVNNNHRSGHNRRSDDKFARERQSSQHRAQSGPRARRKPICTARTVKATPALCSPLRRKVATSRLSVGSNRKRYATPTARPASNEAIKMPVWRAACRRKFKRPMLRLPALTEACTH